MVGAIKLTAFGQPDVPISRDLVNQVPYASIAAKIGRGPRSLLVLWRTERTELHWLSADGVAIVTSGGRVVRTAGLPESIRSTIFQEPDPVSTGLHLESNRVSASREVDLAPDGVTTWTSNFRLVGPKKIAIADIDFETILVREHVKVLGTNWNIQNLFWVDPVDGFVWRSRQTIARTFPPIEIDVLKPAII
ncbi:MAG: YjbF family lipoprotein [Alphaproteobacteria bacterium]